MDRRNDVLDFLLTRRSRPAKLLSAPAPSAEDLREILTAAARTPDHGKLEPWRFIVLEEPALQRLSGLVVDLSEARGMGEDDYAKQRDMYARGPLAVAVIASPKASKIPEIEQLYSAGAACLALLNAALAAGWGANWLSGWASHDPEFLSKGLGLETHEKVAGLIFIGSTEVTPPERPRPDLDAITSWVTE
ncbi:MAG: nitroreductase family protein [Mangrovicoccus sp.]